MKAIEKKIRIEFGLALTCLLVIGAVSYHSASRFLETFRSVEHTQVVLDQLHQTVIAVLNAETGERGYALTGNELFLEAIEPGRAAVQEKLTILRELTADNPLQQQHLNTLQALVSKKLQFIAEIVGQRKAGAFDPAARAIATGEGKKMMDQIRKEIREMEATERELLEARSNKTQAEARRAIQVVVLGSVMAILFVAFASFIVHRDFQKRQQAEQERDRFFTLSLDMLCTAGFDGYFKRLNPAWEKVLGFTSEELMARPFIEFIHPDDREATNAQSQKIAAGAPVLSFENRYQCKDGSYRWFLWSATPLLEAKVVYAAARDITDRKSVDDRIQQLNHDLAHRAADLQAANKELEAFSYSVSHDLRAPLRHISGFLDLLQKKAGTALDSTCQRYLTMIAGSAKEMGTLIDDLLAFSRMGRSEMRATAFDLKQLTEEAIASLKPETAEREIVWKIGALPEVKADPALLRQVMANLLANAIKYTRGHSPAQIEIGCQPDQNGEHIFFVRDNGVGFDMEYANKLFGVFQRLHTAEEFEGTGIGLATVRRIINRHGGRTWAEGAVDAGATFYFSLPHYVSLANAA